MAFLSAGDDSAGYKKAALQVMNSPETKKPHGISRATFFA